MRATAKHVHIAALQALARRETVMATDIGDAFRP
jgi:hypothetical protein